MGVGMLMNVLKEQTAVLRPAQTQLGATHAHVTQAIVWQVTDKSVTVSVAYSWLNGLKCMVCRNAYIV